MNKLSRLKEVACIFSLKIADTFDSTVIKGSKLSFLKLQIAEIVDYTLGAVFGKFKGIQEKIKEKKKRRQQQEFIVKNSIGKFAISNKNDSIIMSSAFYDPFQKSWLKKEGKKDIFLDIGANIGHYTILAKKEGYARVYAFEPNPNTYKILRKNILLNKLTNTKIYPFGAGSINGNAPFERDDLSTGGNRFLDNSESKNNASHLKLKKLDDFLLNHKISCKDIDFIKIDVEGAEMHVLEGMKNTLKNLSPGTVLMIEIWDRHPRRKETLDFISKSFMLTKQYDDNYLFVKKGKKK